MTVAWGIQQHKSVFRNFGNGWYRLYIKFMQNTSKFSPIYMMELHFNEAFQMENIIFTFGAHN